MIGRYIYIRNTCPVEFLREICDEVESGLESSFLVLDYDEFRFTEYKSQSMPHPSAEAPLIMGEITDLGEVLLYITKVHLYWKEHC